MLPSSTLRLVLTMAALGLAAAGCTRSSGTLEPLPPNTEPVVFDDAFGPGVDYQAFMGSKTDAVSLDMSEFVSGTASLRITVPNPGDPSGTYAGGAFTTSLSRDLTGYNALTFWAKGSRAATLDVVGLGNDNTGTSRFEARWSAVPLTTTWTRYVVPIPLAARLTSERGLFFFAEGPEGGAGYTVWFDDVKFELVTDITNPRPVLTTRSVGSFVGSSFDVQGTQTTFAVSGSDRVIAHQAGYFTFVSSNETVARVAGARIQVVGGGTAAITARLGSVDAVGTLKVNATAPPAEAAPAPTLPPGDVISLFSNAYSNRMIDTWSATWDQADVTDLRVAGDDVKAYTNLSFAGIEFTSQTIDATAMTHLHMDVWLPQGNVFRIKLVDFGANGEFGGGDDREHELFFNAATTPPLVTGQWMSLDIPFTSFLGLTTRGHLAQIILSGDPGTAFIDNVYFHR